MRLHLANLRMAARSLRRAPGFSAAVVVLLGLGIGASTVLFSAADALLLAPLPYPDADRLAVVWEKNVPRKRMRNVVAPVNFLAWRQESRSFDTLAALAPGLTLTLTGGGEPEHVRATAVTSELLPLLGGTPARGHGFSADERGAVLLDHGFWQRRFGADPSVVGRTLELSGVRYTVAGVLPDGFRFLFPSDVFVPLALDAGSRVWAGRSLVVVGHLARGATLRRAQAEMESLSARLAELDREHLEGWSVNVVPLKEQLTGGFRAPLLVLLSAVLLLLVIACMNVANLLLARTAARRHELAVRMAIGASRGQLVGQLMAEATLLALLGGGLGLVAAHAALGAVSAARPIPLPPGGLALSPVAVGMAGLVALLVALGTGLGSALGLGRRDVASSLNEGARGTSAGSARMRFRGLLVTAETALSILLLVGAGLLLRSFRTLVAVDPGFAPERVLTLPLSLPESRYAGDEKKTAFLEALLSSVRALPGVEATGAVTALPLGGGGAATSYRVEGEEEPSAARRPTADIRIVAGDYFGTMGIPLVAGRGFKASESAGAPLALVVNRTMARQHWPSGDPLGKRVRVSWAGGLIGEVVGVAGDVRLASLDAEPRPTIYWDARQSPPGSIQLVLRTSGHPAALAPPVREAVRALDPDLVAATRPMGELLSASVAERRVVLILLALFGAAATLLTAVGLYGVVSGLVSQRTYEFGIRMALGATRGDVLTLVLRKAAALTGAGIAIGLVVALGLAPRLTHLLFGVGPHDLPTFLAVTALLGTATLLACYLPARRATRVDPIASLRAE